MINQILDYIKNLPSFYLTSFGIMAFVALVSIVVGYKVKHMDVKARPGKIMSLFIGFIGFFNNYVKSYVGKNFKFVAPITLTMAFYVLISNISGVIALESPTRFTAITFSLSIIFFITVQTTGFLSNGWKHILGVTKPLWPMTPLNIVGDFTPILSIALRLFGNIASGAVILTLIYRGIMAIGNYTGWATIVIMPVFHAVFDIGFGLVQTLVIVLLTIIFASTKVDDKDLEIN